MEIIAQSQYARSLRYNFQMFFFRLDKVMTKLAMTKTASADRLNGKVSGIYYIKYIILIILLQRPGQW